MKYFDVIIELGIFISFINIILSLSDLFLKADNKPFTFNKKNYIYIFAILALIALDYILYHSFKNTLKGIYLGLGISVLILTVMFVTRLGLSIWFRFGFDKFSYLSQIDKTGFSIQSKDKTHSYSWTDFNDASFDSSKQKIKFKGQKNITIKKKMGGWYRILNSIPRTYQSIDYSYIDELFKDLNTCKVCGMIASNNKECLYCGSTIWNNELMTSYESEEKYIIECQLDQYATMEKSEKFSGFSQKDDFFKQDPSWKPLVTKEQVLEYSKKEYWEEED